MNLDINDILIAPLISEKSTQLAGSRRYVFKVHKSANKIMIKQAVEKLYPVKVKDCNILNVFGKKRRINKRNAYTYTPGWKKAVVTLKEGEFDFFETLQ